MEKSQLIWGSVGAVAAFAYFRHYVQSKVATALIELYNQQTGTKKSGTGIVLLYAVGVIDIDPNEQEVEDAAWRIARGVAPYWSVNIPDSIDVKDYIVDQISKHTSLDATYVSTGLQILEALDIDSLVSQAKAAISEK